MPQSQEKLYEGEGRLIAVRIIPGDKEAKLFFIGRKAGEARLVPSSRLVSVRMEGGDRDEELRFKENGDSYLIHSFPKGHDFSLRVRADVQGEPDVIDVRPAK